MNKKNNIQYDFHLREEYLMFLKYCRPRKTDKILDIGPGGGAGLKYLKDKGFAVTGLEIDKKQAKYSEKNSGIKVVVYDGVNFPFKKDNFSYVILSHVLEHIENHNIMLKEIKRILKPGGQIFISVPNRYDIYGRLKSFLKREKYIFFTDPTHKIFYTLSKLKDVVKNAGFSEIKQFGKSFFIPLLTKLINSKEFYRLLGYLPILKHFTTGNIVIARKT